MNTLPFFPFMEYNGQATQMTGGGVLVGKDNVEIEILGKLGKNKVKLKALEKLHMNDRQTMVREVVEVFDMKKREHYQESEKVHFYEDGKLKFTFNVQDLED